MFKINYYQPLYLIQLVVSFWSALTEVLSAGTGIMPWKIFSISKYIYWFLDYN